LPGKLRDHRQQQENAEQGVNGARARGGLPPGIMEHPEQSGREHGKCNGAVKYQCGRSVRQRDTEARQAFTIRSHLATPARGGGENANPSRELCHAKELEPLG